MKPKMLRRSTLAGQKAGNSKELEGNFDPQISEHAGDPPESDTPIAHSRIVIGHCFSFIYIEYCPLCGLEHIHGQYPLQGPYNDPAEAFDACDGHRASHCDAHGLGRIMHRIGGERCNGYSDPPPEYHEPRGDLIAS